MITGNYEVIKTVNISLVLDILRQKKELSRSDISRLTGLTSGTITNIVHQLLEFGLVEEVDAEAPSTGGRRPIYLRLHPQGGYAIGMELTTWGMQAVLFNFLAEPIKRVERLGSFRYQQGIRQMIELIEECRQVLDTNEQKRLLGVGISVPGWVHFQSGKIYKLPNLPGWEQVLLKSDLEKHINLPVFIDNDANLAAHGELWFGPEKNFQQLFYILVSDGIGAGIVLNNQVYHGKGYSVGELGHLSLGLSEEECSCGKRGCLDATASVKAILQEYSKLKQEAITIKEMNQRFQAGEAEAQLVIRKAADNLGRGIAAIINIYGPDAIIIGGEIVNDNPHYLDLVKEATLQYSLPIMSQDVLMIPSQLKDKSTLYGCCAMVFQSTLQPFSLQALGNYSHR